MKSQRRFVFILLIVSFLIGLFAFSGVALAGDNEQQSTFASPILVVNTSFLNVRSGPGAQYTILVTVVGGTELPVLGVANDKVWYLVATDAGPGWVNVSFTLPRGDFTNVPLTDINDVALLGQGGGGATSVDLGQGGGAAVSSALRAWGVSMLGGDLRTEPNSNSPIVQALLGENLNAVYPVLGATMSEGRQWYAAHIPGVGTGWSDRFVLRPLECNVGDTAIVVTSSVGTVPQGTTPPFVVEAGEEGFAIGGRDSFIEVELRGGGVTGLIPLEATRGRAESIVSFCDSVAITPSANNVASLGQGGGGAAPAAPPVPVIAGSHVVVNTGFLNIRSGPGAQFSIITTVPGGVELAVAGRAKDGVWMLVSGAFGQGWLNNEFVLFRGDYASVPVIASAAIGAFIVPTTNSAANLGQGGGVTPPTNVVVSPRVWGVSMLGGDLRTGPDSNSPIVQALLGENLNAVYPVLGATMSEGRQWYAAHIPGVGTGWSDRFVLRPLECNVGDTAIVVTSSVGTVPQGTTPPFVVEAGEEGFAIGGRDSFIEVELRGGGVTGLIPLEATRGRAESIVSFCDGVTVANPANVANLGQGGGFAPPVIQGPKVVVNTGNLNIRSGPSAAFSIVTTVPGGTELAVIGRAKDGVWMLVSGAFGQGWLNNEFVLFRGDYASVPIIDVRAGN